MSSDIFVRSPTAPKRPQPTFSPPTTDWLSGTWHVSHSTLPKWKSKRNIRITYKPLPPSTESITEGTDRLEDTVSYQGLTSEEVKNVVGVDKASLNALGAWDWRGRSWLKIASSHWEVLGFGSKGGEEWVVTYFAKTLFTPDGIDVYSRSKGGLSMQIFSEIKEAMVNDPKMKTLIAKLFEIQRDEARAD